jgi:predicted kinase
MSSKVHKGPKAPTQIQDMLLGSSMRERHELSDYLLQLKVSSWSCIREVVEDCIAKGASRVFDWKDLHQEHLNALDKLSKSQDCTTFLQVYSLKLYNYYDTENAKNEFESVVKKHSRKRKLDETHDEADIVTNKLVKQEGEETAMTSEQLKEDTLEMEWMAGDFNMTQSLCKFRDMSKQSNPQTLSDLRLL